MFWKDKRVLVTGGDGFIGSHLVEILRDRGAKVRALSLYNSFNDWGWLETIQKPKDVEIVTGDIRDYDSCLKMTKDIDVVFHLAALIAIPYSYDAPGSYVETNIKGTLNICRAALSNRCQKVVHTSTSEVYGTARYAPIDEEHPLQPQSPYSASKIGADALAMSFYSAFKLPLTIARPFNTFGPRQSARAVIPTIISQISAGKKEIELGDTRPTRDFNYVLDTCEGMILLAEKAGSDGQVYNLGSNVEISIGDLFRKIADFMNSNVQLVKDDARLRPENSEVFRLLCSNKKFTELTGYKTQVGLDDGLKRTIQWFSNPFNLKRYKVDIYNV